RDATGRGSRAPARRVRSRPAARVPRGPPGTRSVRRWRRGRAGCDGPPRRSPASARRSPRAAFCSGVTRLSAAFPRIARGPGSLRYLRAVGGSAVSLVLLEKSEGIATVTLDRPEALNALNLALRRAIEETFRELQKDSDTRVVILTGAGRAFCAGIDLKE